MTTLRGPNTSSSSGFDAGGGAVRGNTDFDVTILKIGLVVPPGTNCMVGLDFRFYSEEYPEFVGSSFNDAFIAELDRSTWTTSGSIISAPDNFAFDPAGNPITINAAGVTSMRAEHAVGTSFDGATPLLRAATPITPGGHSLYLSVFDQGDHRYDSAVILDNMRFGTVQDVARDCRAGAVPVETGPSYVAFGDSLTTGESIKTCNSDLKKSKWGCQSTPAGAAPRVPPYPQRVAESRNLDLDRVGIWGYSLARATAIYPGSAEQSWPSQLSEINRARVLVTGALGINDMGFSDWKHWLWQYRTGQARSHATDHVSDLDDELDELFGVLAAAKARGVKVVVTTYYNPYDGQTGCGTTHGIADLILKTLNGELTARAEDARLLVADIHTPFNGHGANSDDSFVFGSQCDLSGAIGASFPDWDQSEADGKRGVQERFDPHPNAKGTAAMARAVEAVL